MSRRRGVNIANDAAMMAEAAQGAGFATSAGAAQAGASSENRGNPRQRAGSKDKAGPSKTQTKAAGVGGKGDGNNAENVVANASGQELDENGQPVKSAAAKRLALLSELVPLESVIKAQGRLRGFLSRRRMQRLADETHVSIQKMAVKRIGRWYLVCCHLRTQREDATAAEELTDETNKARLARQRRREEKALEIKRDKAATFIQQTWRVYLIRSAKTREQRDFELDAVKVLQRGIRKTNTYREDCRAQDLQVIKVAKRIVREYLFTAKARQGKGDDEAVGNERVLVTKFEDSTNAKARGRLGVYKWKVSDWRKAEEVTMPSFMGGGRTRGDPSPTLVTKNTQKEIPQTAQEMEAAEEKKKAAKAAEALEIAEMKFRMHMRDLVAFASPEEVQGAVQGALLRCQNSGGYSLNLSDKEVVTMPPFLNSFNSLTALSLARNRIKVVPSELCTALTSITDLRLNDNRITTLPDNLGVMTTLLQLWLHNNRMAVLPRSVGKLVNLHQLSLAHCSLVTLPWEVSRLTAVNNLKLKGNKLLVNPPLNCRMKKGQAVKYLRSINDSKIHLCHWNLQLFPRYLSAYNKVTVMHLDHNNIRVIDERIFHCMLALEELGMSYNKIVVIPGSVKHQTRLTQLDLRYNLIEVMPMEFVILTRLKGLDLKGNALKAPSQEILDHSAERTVEYLQRVKKAPLVHRLEIEGMGVVKIPSIHLHTRLSKLSLSHNSIRSVPIGVWELGVLRWLDLSHNRIKTVASGIERCSNLVRLDLSSNRLGSLPKEIGYLLRLKRFTASLNRIQVLPDSIGDLFRILDIDLSYNRLLRLPTTLGGLLAVRRIDVSFNRISSLPQSLDITSLVELNLDANQIEHLTPELNDCWSLSSLSCRQSGVCRVNPMLNKLVGITSLDLTSNNICNLSDDWRLMSTLKTLNLSHNSFETIPIAVCLMPALTELSFSYNFIVDLPLNVVFMTSVETLDLSHNNMERVSSSIIGMVGLINLDLSHNRLQFLPPHLMEAPVVFGKLEELKSLNLRDNHLFRLPSDLWLASNITDLRLMGNSRLPSTWTAQPKDMDVQTLLLALRDLQMTETDRINAARLAANEQSVKLTPHGEDFTTDKDLVRELDQMARSDKKYEEVTEWRRKLEREPKTWEQIESFFLIPRSVMGTPWEINQEMWHRQKTDMRAYIDHKAASKTAKLQAFRQKYKRQDKFGNDLATDDDDDDDDDDGSDNWMGAGGGAGGADDDDDGDESDLDDDDNADGGGGSEGESAAHRDDKSLQQRGHHKSKGLRSKGTRMLSDESDLNDSGFTSPDAVDDGDSSDESDFADIDIDDTSDGRNKSRRGGGDGGGVGSGSDLDDSASGSGEGY